jgi:hypothetical protein
MKKDMDMDTDMFTDLENDLSTNKNMAIGHERGHYTWTCHGNGQSDSFSILIDVFS